MDPIVYEGNVTLDYCSGDCNREIELDTGESLENYIANSLGFPTSAEFDEMLTKVRAAREAGQYDADTDAKRNVRVRITVEVI